MALITSLTDLERLLLTTPDDTEDAPWMVMDNRQVHQIERVRSALFLHVERHGVHGCIESHLPIVVLRPDGRRALQVSPDLMVAQVENRARSSWDVIAEQMVPELIVEVSSAASLRRDRDDKPAIYGSLRIGRHVVREYVLFAPFRHDGGPILSGHRRDESGTFVPWDVDAQGVLWSQVLGGLGLSVEDGMWLRATDADGRRLPTQEEGRREAEQEAQRLREELRRLREGKP